MAREDFDAASNLPEYDIDKIHTVSQDPHGHSSAPRATMPKNMFAQIGMYVTSPVWPEYTSSAAFIRDAVHHRLHWAATQADRTRIPGAARQIRIAAQVARADEYREMLNQVNDLIQTMETTVKAAQASGDFDEEGRLLDEFEDLAREEFTDPHLEKILTAITVLRTKRYNRF